MTYDDELYLMMGLGDTPLSRVDHFSTSGSSTLNFTGLTAGQLLVAVSSVGSSATPPSTASGGWVLWGNEAHATQNAAVSVYTKVATGPTDSILWVGSTGLRMGWAFEGAQIDQILFTQGVSTGLTWPNLTGITANSLGAAYLVSRGAQVDIDGSIGLAAPFVTRVAKNTSSAAWSGDTENTKISSFNPGADTFDSDTNGWIAVAISVKDD